MNIKLEDIKERIEAFDDNDFLRGSSLSEKIPKLRKSKTRKSYAKLRKDCQCGKNDWIKIQRGYQCIWCDT